MPFDGDEREIERVFKIYQEGVFATGWIRNCAERAVQISKLPAPIRAPREILDFLNQATSCYILDMHKACVVLCGATLEAILRHEKKDQKSSMSSLIDTSKGNLITCNEMYKDAKFIDDWRNPYAHANKSKWKAVKNGRGIGPASNFLETPFDETLGDEHVAYQCLTKLRRFAFEIYGEKK